MSSFRKHAEDLELTAVDDGFIAYDEARDWVHYLNRAAALVFVLCSGRNTSEDIARLIQEQFALDAPPQQEVSEILAQFADQGLAAPVQQSASAPR
jgi:Coenzyme PQQ synthesis protein D (PqqD)